MNGTRKFKKAGIDYEEITRLKFQNIETQKHYRVNLVEPVGQEDLDKLGTSILEAEYTIDADGTETIGGMKEYRLEDAPPAYQGMVADYRRRLIRDLQHSNGLEEILGDLVEAGIAEAIPDSLMPEGIGAVMFKPLPSQVKKWKLFDKNSDMEMPWGEILRSPDGEEYELLKGTPKTHLTIRDEQGIELLVQPGLFDLEWREVKKA